MGQNRECVTGAGRIEEKKVICTAKSCFTESLNNVELYLLCVLISKIRINILPNWEITQTS